MTLLCASLPIADIVLFALLALALVLGIIRGLAKSFKGLFLSIVIVLCALLLISPTFTPVRNLEIFSGMNTSITQKLSGTEIMSTPIYIEEVENEDGTKSISYFVEKEVDGTMQRVPLSDAMQEGNMLDGIKGKINVWLVSSFITEDGQTIGGVAGDFVTDLIVMVIMFIVYCIAMGLVCWLIRRLVKGMHTSENKAVRVVDRCLGAVVSVALMFVGLLVILSILSALSNKYPVINDYLADSKVVGPLYIKNPIAELWAKIFG